MEIGTDAFKAASIIQNGGLVAFPTETVYGLGANALNSLACARIFEEKQRPTFDPLIIHIYQIEQLYKIFESPIPDTVFELALNFWPGPLTIVYKKMRAIPDIVTAGLQTVAVRMPSNSTAMTLLEISNVPIAAPSANKFGSLSPTKPEHVLKQNFNIDYLLLGENPTKGIESTILLIEENECFLLRPGAVAVEEINKIRNVRMDLLNQKNNSPSILAPGRLKYHYSPKKATFLYKEEVSIPSNSALIAHKKKLFDNRFKKILYTSENENLIEIAANLFDKMHILEDDNEVENIFIEPVKPEGLGLAIMDRISKACAKYSS